MIFNNTLIKMIGQKIYECMINRGLNPVELLRNLNIDFPDDIEETDINHNEKTNIKSEETTDKQIINIDLDKMEKIRLDDGSISQTFYLYNNKILLKNNIEVGKYNIWQDFETEIPRMYKNKENIVLDPNNRNILYEYSLYEDMNMYHELDTNIIYRQYKYDYGLDRFIKLSGVTKIS